MKKLNTLFINENISLDMAIGAILSVGFILLGFLSRSFALDLQANILGL